MGERPIQFSQSVDPSTILIVDDDPDTRAIVRQTLAALGHFILEAEDGVVACARCNEQLPDVIVLDVMMPNMGGLEFIGWLRSTYSQSFVPILLLTALGTVENRVQGLDVGADDYLVKPFNYRELQARVQALLRIRRLTNDLYRRTEELQLVNQQLADAQAELLRKERELVTMQLAGAAAHSFGQPITTILLNCRIVERGLATEQAAEEKQLTDAKAALQSIQRECESMSVTLGRLKAVDPSKLKEYVGRLQILDIDS